MPAKPTTTVPCPLCGTSISHTFSGWFCAKPGCGFAAPHDTQDEYDLLYSDEAKVKLQVWDAAQDPEQNITKTGGRRVQRLVSQLMIGDVVVDEHLNERTLSHDPVGIGSGIKLLRFTDGTVLKVMAHADIVSTAPPQLFVYDINERELYTVRDGDTYILWIENISRQQAMEIAEKNGVDLSITENLIA